MIFNSHLTPVVDGQIPILLFQLIDITCILITKFTAIVLLSPVFIIPGIVFAIAGVSLGHVYMKAQLPVKRESSNARAPVLGHFGAAVGGLGTNLSLLTNLLHGY